MSLPAENSVIESTIEVAERQRRWLRRGCWIGCGLALVAIVVVMSFPLFARWQLRRHGWELDTPFSGRTGGAGSVDAQWVDHWFGRIDAAHLKHASLRTSDIALLRQFPNAGWITLESTDVSDSELATISQLPNLWGLDFDTVRLESTALRHLATAGKLEALNFYNMVLDDTALEYIAACHNPTGLRLTGVTDDNVRYLARIPSLLGLGIRDCRLTDQGAKHLANRCLGLKVLNLDGGTFSDAAIDEFARLPNLEDLSLSDVAITDDGILKLKTCTTLKNVYFRKTKVTAAGAAELRKSLPSLDVFIE